jgi:Prokaryotic metallothionein
LLIRVLLFVFLVYIFYVVLKAYWLPRKSKFRFVNPRKVDDMVLDPQCQTYVPKNEAIPQNGNYFCSRECARLFLLR